MRKTHLLTAILAVFTVLLLTWNVSLATSAPNPSLSVLPPDFDLNEVNPISIVFYKPTEIARPLTYWTLTEPIDPYIPFAISVGNWIPCRENETTFLQQVEEHNGEWKIEYQGSYYEIEALLSGSPHPEPNIHVLSGYKTLHLIPHTTEHATSSILLAGLWGCVLIVWKRRNGSV
jgi:hypothetical protein